MAARIYEVSMPHYLTDAAAAPLEDLTAWPLMAVDCGAIRAAVGLADNHVSRGYGPGLGCDGQLTGVGDKTEEERAGDGTVGS